MSTEKVLIFGNGFVASLLAESDDPRFDVVISQANVLDEAALRAAFEEHRPAIVVNTAAKTNIDWCESHRDITFQVNVLGSDNVAKVCAETGAYLVQFSSGCLQESRGPNDMKRESDAINPLCFYAWTKAWSEHLISDRCTRDGLRALFIRPRLLMSSRLSSRNSILKLLTYSRFIDVEQSATIAEDMVSALWELVAQRAVGAYNVANPGLISPWEIAGMLRETIAPDLAPIKIPVEDLNAFTRVRRIRTVLSTDRLRQHDIELPEIKTGLRNVLLALKSKIGTAQGRSVLAATEQDTRAKLRSGTAP
jgi:dTDP-4-dehydrorhamnose reductase